MKWGSKILAGLSIACTAVVAAHFGYARGVTDAPEIADDRAAEFSEMGKWLRDVSGPGLPTDRADFCDLVVDGASDVLWEERRHVEGAAADAAADVYR